MIELADMMEAGLTLPPDALCTEQWILVGKLRQWRNPRWQM